MFHHIAVVARTQAARAPVVVSRQLHATPTAAKTVTEKVSEVADTVNKKVGKGLASALDAGEEVTEKSKQVLGTSKEKAQEATDAVKEKTSEGTAQAAQKKNELESDVKQSIRKD
ncbi:hypothetical protein HETIRDRAFT_421111 [Heterobasidion irregulare TC 32-1]|uniref:Uncharacterized protein n=1 Tax=Heterobasidion irregulare (strain TC 32-1) TaxID=747525 RepID=W4JZV6_HETIT|nr:uncharacterized protein HETIRDRAFT_421111 [Heterobasidion irregulare TC 32-1]ETW78376.1 hypothetical protein HETIRDRAFT_421111 [Heterobasidion irregulare TC 32-1]